MAAEYLIGTSGFSYNHWRGNFYPQDLAQYKWLEFYTSQFSTVEINNTFYRLPPAEYFQRWKRVAPAGFVYAVKVSRLITHYKRLRDIGSVLESFVSRARILGDALGPLLYQLPPSMAYNEAALRAFLKLLPEDIRHVIEFRHESWLHDRTLELLRQHNVGFCVFDMPGMTAPATATSNFAYFRFHGSTGIYGSCYSDDELRGWADRIIALGINLKTVYVYFNNDFESYATKNARTIREYLTASSH